MSGGSKTCQHCGCSEIEIDKARGDAVCTNCGSVLEANIIVSEVQFEDNAKGGSSALGQFVSMDGGTITRSITDGLHVGYGRESRAVTLESGRKRIVEVAQQLRLNQHCIDTAFNFFKMAVHRHLTRGRRSGNVVGACLYIVCRVESTPHMLLDFCDVLQVNVFDLGKTYLRLSAALCLNIPAIDPCLYIVRFAHRLQFAEKTHEVSMTALRLVQRMKRDWMHTGRKPSGLCGAALLVAARLHDFRRTPGDIIRVVKVCNATLRKRLLEFGETPSSRLTLDEFMKIDLEEEQDPPSFRASLARHKARLKQFGDQETVSMEVSKLQMVIERKLEEKKAKSRGFYANCSKESSGSTGFVHVVNADRESEDTNRFIEEETIETIERFVIESEPDSTSRTASSSTNFSQSLGPMATSFIGGESISEEYVSVNTANDNSNSNVGGELDLTGIDDDEVDSYILSWDEVQRKSDLWHKVNATYLLELKEKEEKAAKEREENGDKPEKKKRTRRKKQPIHASTAGEAIEKMLQEKRLSTKINYDVLRNLTSAFATDLSSNTKSVSPSSTVNVVQSEPNEIRDDSQPTPSKIARIDDGPLPLSNIEDLAVNSVAPDEDMEDEIDDYDEEDVEDQDQSESVADLLRRHRGEYEDE